MNTEDNNKFDHLRGHGLLSAANVAEQEDVEEADRLCSQMIDLVDMTPEARNFVLGNKPLPDGYRNVRFRNGLTGEMYGEVFRIDGSSVTIKGAVIWLAAETCSLGDLISVRRGPTRDEGYLELFVRFGGKGVRKRY